MSYFDNIAKFSPLPIVDLNKPDVPRDGLLVRLNDTCRKNYAKGDKCHKHYEQLSQTNYDSRELVQCPYGFTSIEFRVGDRSAALTGFIPYPRLKGAQERIIAKRHKEVILSTDKVQEIISTLKKIAQQYRAIDVEAAHRISSTEREAEQLLREVDEETAKKHSMALHEIRKLNRTVVQTAERLCLRESPENPEFANPALVTIWKTAELMSKQFDVVEILANESLTTLPVKTPIHLYKIFDKCVRVYQVQRADKRLFIQGPPNYSPRIYVCEKTFPIIPTVLISNALKYSIPRSDIRVTLEPDSNYCLATVSSIAQGGELEKSIFQRGVRASLDKEGSGIGLYVAQLVAKQHGTEITVQSIPVSSDPSLMKHIFKVRFRLIRS